jgi:hypothetical protein
MARITLGQKAVRALLLLLGLRHPQVARALRRRGFTDAELARGYELLQALSAGRLNVAITDAAAHLAELDRWENQNFPIIEAVIKRHFPELHAAIFLNLSQTTGPELVVFVKMLLERLDAQPEAVREKLAERGVTADVLGEARELLQTIASIAPDHTDQIDSEADAAAEKALWDWYLEWSTIVRTDITNRRLLRYLGFLKRPSGEVVEAPLPETPEDDDEPSEPSTPVAPPTPVNPDEPPPFV